MTDAPHCDLCRRRPPAGFSLAGLSCCGTCAEGFLFDALHNWSLKLTSEQSREMVPTGGKPRTMTVTRIGVEFGTRGPDTAFDLGVRARLRREEGWVFRWLGFGRDPEVGDPLFDDFVHIEAKEGDLVPLIADEGLQGAIMEIVGSGTLEVQPHSVLATLVLRGSDLTTETAERLVVAIAVHLVRARYAGP